MQGRISSDIWKVPEHQERDRRSGTLGRRGRGLLVQRPAASTASGGKKGIGTAQGNKRAKFGEIEIIVHPRTHTGAAHVLAVSSITPTCASRPHLIPFRSQNDTEGVRAGV